MIDSLISIIDSLFSMIDSLIIGKTDIKLIIESKYKEEREQKLYWHVYVKLHLMGN